MPIVVEVAFKPLSKLIPCAPGALELILEDAVIVDGPGGAEFGFVKTPARAVPDDDAPPPVRRVLRRALPDDWQRREKSRSASGRSLSGVQRENPRARFAHETD